MAKKLEVEINVQDNADASISRLKELKNQIRNVSAGSEDFRNLRAEMDDIEDSLKSGRTAAGNFVDILGTVPGPIGEIGSRAAGTIDTLKGLGKLNMGDLAASLTALKDDVVSAAKGLANLTGITKVYTVINNALAASFVKVGVGEAAAATGARAFAAALTATGVGVLVVAVGLLVNGFMELANSVDSTSLAVKKLKDELEKTSNFYDTDLKNLQRRQARELAELKAKGATEIQIREKQLKDKSELEKLAYERLLEIEENYNKASKLTDEKYTDETKAAENAAFDALQKARQDYEDAKTAKIIQGYDNTAAAIKEKEEKATKDREKSFSKQEKEIENRFKLQIETAKLNGEETLGLELKYLEEKKSLLKKFGNDVTNIDIEISLKRQQIKNSELNSFRAAETQYEDEMKKKREREKEIADQFLNTTNEEYNTSISNLNDYYKNLYKEIDTQFANGEISQFEYNNKIFDLETQHYDNMLTIQKDYGQSTIDLESLIANRKASIKKESQQKERELVVSGTQSILQDISNLNAAFAGQTVESQRKAFKTQKALSIASTTIDTYASAQRAYASQLIPGDPTSPIRAAIAAAITVASGLARVAIISKQQFSPASGGGDSGGGVGEGPKSAPSKFKNGGLLTGRTHAAGGIMTPMGELEGGEFVVNRASTQSFLPLLEAINNLGKGVNVSQGNVSSSVENAGIMGQTPIIKTYVVASDVTSAQEANKRIADLAKL